MQPLFFDNWFGLLRTVIAGVCAYVTLVVFLRISGKRTLSKMNAFDMVVTVALGSSLATVLLNKNVALAEGATAFLTLIVLQFIVAWLSVRSRAVAGLVKSEPALLMYRGEFLQQVLRRERVTEGEVLAAVRSNGLTGLGEVEAVVLETDGTFSVVGQESAGRSTLAGLRPSPEQIEERGLVAAER